jgi:alpha-galactosidase
MVNPDSDLFSAHPDWVYNFPNREGTLGRNQLCLNLSKLEVKEFILNFMTEFLEKNNIRFIKWDMNRTISEPGWMEVPKEQQREIWVRHVENLYSIWDKLRERFPRVIFEACAGGGGRIDLGILKRADQVWTSDNTDAFDKLKIQEGFSYAYCIKAMMCWVTEAPNFINGRRLSLKYRFHSAMMGSLGIGADINKWNDEELEEATSMIAEYKEIRGIVQEGDLYRLHTPREGNLTVVQYVDESKYNCVVFVFLHSGQFGEGVFRVKLKGLEKMRIYNIVDDCKTYSMSGSGLMNIGLELQMKGDFISKLIRIGS